MDCLSLLLYQDLARILTSLKVIVDRIDLGKMDHLDSVDSEFGNQIHLILFDLEVVSWPKTKRPLLEW